MCIFRSYHLLSMYDLLAISTQQKEFTINKVMKIVLATSAMLVISSTIGCSKQDDENNAEKWCVVNGTNSKKDCYQIYPKSELIFARSVAACADSSNTEISDRPNISECILWDTEEKKWCVYDDINHTFCYKIYPESEYPIAKSVAACRLSGVLDPKIKATDRVNRNECEVYDDGSK